MKAKMDRKIVQIQTSLGALVALCDDGTLWCLKKYGRGNEKKYARWMKIEISEVETRMAVDAAVDGNEKLPIFDTPFINVETYP